MTDEIRTTLGDVIFANIDANKYLGELYNRILLNYALTLIGADNSMEHCIINIEDALRFADILSKSTSETKADSHKLWAQEIAALLRFIYPENPVVQKYFGSVLLHNGNFLGLQKKTPEYRGASLFDRFYAEFSHEFFSIPADKGSHFFSSQKKIYERLNDSHFSYSGPTSMGKSFIVRMFIKAAIMNNERQNFVLLVPTKALINEVSSKIINDLKELLEEKNYKVVTSAGALALEGEHNFVFVLTPERLLYLLIGKEDVKIDFLFVDEAHKISTKDSRSPFYYKVIDMLMQREKSPRVIFASPNIPNPSEFLKLVTEIENIDSLGLSTSFAPVSQVKFLVDFYHGTIQLFNGRVNRPISISNFNVNMSFYDFVNMIGKTNRTNTDSKYPQNIVYSNGISKVITMACEFAKQCKPINSKELQTLAKDIGNEIHGDYYLSQIVTRGVAYHIGYLPSAIRMRIEQMFKDGHIHTIFCTSTLIEGVNLPADNLFITSYKNGNVAMDAVNFRNLIGRVGRIEFNLYGNVFLVRPADAKRFDSYAYEGLLREEVPPQKLSIVTALSADQKKLIVSRLLEGDISLQNTEKLDSEDYAIMRKFANILLRDIHKNRNSLVRREFSQFLTKDDETKILSHFTKQGSAPDDDINVSVDQTESLTAAIYRNLRYPAIDIETGYVDYNELITFLERLCKIFKWEIYESSTLGHISRKGQRGRLRWYAVLLSQWVKGDGLGSIMRAGINHKKTKDPTLYIDYDYEQYDGSLRHKNHIIADILSTIDRVILFSISNYFLRFSNEYKRVKGVTSFENDWFEYVEYGTTNPLSIMLQRNGFSRETSTYIRRNRQKYVDDIKPQSPKLKKSLLGCGNTSVENEAKDVYYNVPELFAD